MILHFILSYTGYGRRWQDWQVLWCSGEQHKEWMESFHSTSLNYHYSADDCWVSCCFCCLETKDLWLCSQRCLVTVVTVTLYTALNRHLNIYLVEMPTSASESIVEVTKLQNTILEPSEVAMSQSLDTSCTKPSGMLSCFPMCLLMTYYQSRIYRELPCSLPTGLTL